MLCTLNSALPYRNFLEMYRDLSSNTPVSTACIFVGDSGCRGTSCCWGDGCFYPPVRNETCTEVPKFPKFILGRMPHQPFELPFFSAVYPQKAVSTCRGLGSLRSSHGRKWSRTLVAPLQSRWPQSAYDLE